MHSTPAQHADPQADPHDTVSIPHIDAPSPMARDPSELHINAADHAPSAAALDLSLDTMPGAPPLNDNRENLRAAGRRPAGGFARFLVATAIGVAVTIGWQAYGEEAREMLATFAPRLLAASPVQAQSVSADETPVPAPVQAAAEAAPEKPASVADTTAAPQTAAPVQAASAAPAQAAAFAELTPLIEGMSREIASLRQTIEQLKAGQQQMSRDLAKAVDKAVEQESRRRIAATAPPSRPVAPPPPPRYSPTAVPPPQPAVQQQAIVPPPPAPPAGYYASAPRPPRPLP